MVSEVSQAQTGGNSRCQRSEVHRSSKELGTNVILTFFLNLKDGSVDAFIHVRTTPAAEITARSNASYLFTQLCLSVDKAFNKKPSSV